MLVVFLVSIYSLTFGQSNTQTIENSYFVRANGNDQNNGLTENTAFKTLKKAISAVKQNNTIKTITIVGTLDPISEGYTDPRTSTEILTRNIPANGVFTISDDVEVKIMGKDHTSSLSGSNKRNVVVLAVGFRAKVSLENINIGNGGCGLALYGGNVHIGDRVRIENNSNITGEPLIYSQSVQNFLENSGGGIIVTNKGNLIIDGKWWVIGNNKAFLGAGLYMINGSVLITADGNDSGGTFSQNHAIYGGAVYIDRSGTFTMRGGRMRENIADECGGGVFVRGDGRFIKESGISIFFNSVSTIQIHGKNDRMGTQRAKEGYAVYVSRGEITFKRDTNILIGDYFDSETGPWE